MATMKKPAKKYADGGDITMKDKSVVRSKDNTDILNRTKDKSNNSVNTRVKDNSRIKTKMDNSVANTDKRKVKYKIAKGATVNLVAPTAKKGATVKKAKSGTSMKKCRYGCK